MINRMPEQRGLSMIELMVFIVIVGIAVTGVLSVYSSVTRTSVDPMVRKQALAVAESLLEEVLSKPYTYCDPDDAQADTATSSLPLVPRGALRLRRGWGRKEWKTAIPTSRLTITSTITTTSACLPVPGLGIIDLTNTSVTGLNAIQRYKSRVQAGRGL